METKLKEIRKARGYKSARAFAESIGMQEKTYRNYEQGSRNLYLDVACELCNALGCTLDELVGNEREPIQLSDNEAELVETMRSITPEGQQQLMIFARGVASTYAKSNKLRIFKETA